MNYTYLSNINSRIFDICCISHKLPITCCGILGCTDINHNPIKFIKRVSVSGNIDRKIGVRHIISIISRAYVIESNVANSDERVTE